MEALYIKLYEKYSKLKSTKENQIEEINQEQEVKFVEFVTAAESLIKHLTAENKRLSENIDELRGEVVSLRNAKDQQFNEFQERLMDEKQKNQQLSAEMEEFRNLQQEKTCSSERTEQPEEQNVNSNRRSPTVSRGQTDESPMRTTRKRARLSVETDPASSSPAPGHILRSAQRKLSTDQSKTDVSKTGCCQGIIVNGDPYKCVFHGLVECLIGMKVSVGDHPEGKRIRAVHQSSGYSFSLTWVNKSVADEEELLYHVTSLGTFANVAPEWMREVIIFSMRMCPIFFEKVSRVIKHH